jgi:hypothetical protein
MPRFKSFEPDPDITDPNDDYFGTGNWTHEDGTRMYGQGDPQEARELLAANDQVNDPTARPSDYAAELGITDLPGKPALEANAPRPDVTPRPLAPSEVARPELQRPAVTVNDPSKPDAPAAPAKASSAWEQQATPQVANALRAQATEAGLNPDALGSIISHESGWNPSAVNKDTGQHGGLIQFSKAGWPAVAKAAGQPEVTWDDAVHKLSAEEQIPFVVAYYKGKGLTPDSSPGDYYKGTFMPAFAGEGDDFVLGEKDSTEMKGDVRSGKVWEQNQGLDLNHDGKITNGEVRQVGDTKYAQQTGAPGNRLGGSPTAAPGAAPRGLPGGIPGQIGGLAPSVAEIQGVPLSASEIEAKQRDVMDRTHQAMAIEQQTAAARIAGRQEAMGVVEQHHLMDQKDALTQIAKQEKIQAEVSANIEREVNRPIQEIDPKRYVKNMSAGSAVMGFVATIIHAIGQGMQETVGIHTDPTSLLERAITRDVDIQKDALTRGEHQSNNRVAFWTRKLGSAESGEAASRLEARQAAAGLLQIQAQKIENVDLQAQAMAKSQAILDAGQKDAQLIADKEKERLNIKYAAPKPVPPGALDHTLAPVGAEDASPEARRDYAAKYDPKSTADRGQMATLTKEMGQISKLEENLRTLESAYGVRPDEHGRYPARVPTDDNPKGPGKDPYDTTATGPWWNVVDKLTPSDERDRKLADAWTAVEVGSREGWKTEPNGETNQVRLAGIDQPKRDQDAAEKLRALREHIEERKLAIESGTNAPVRAAWKYQNNAPYTADKQGARRQVTGRIDQ